MSTIVGTGLIIGGGFMAAGSVTIGMLATAGTYGLAIPVVVPTSWAGLSAGAGSIALGTYILSNPEQFDNVMYSVDHVTSIFGTNSLPNGNYRRGGCWDPTYPYYYTRRCECVREPWKCCDENSIFTKSK